MTKKRRRPIHLHVMVSEEELALIRARMAEAGVRNMGAYVRKMALNGYVLHVDLGPVRELVSLQRRCSNNLNQVAIQANTYGGPAVLNKMRRRGIYCPSHVKGTSLGHFVPKKKEEWGPNSIPQHYFSSGRYATISSSVQSKILHSASSVFVETDSFALRRRIVELLIPPLNCSVYVVAPRFSIVSHNGAYEIIQVPPSVPYFTYLHYCL